MRLAYHEPNHQLEGVIVDVTGASSGNPRYTVALDQADRPLPGMAGASASQLEIYAYAAPQSYHQAAAGQFRIDQRVLIQQVAGVMSIVGLAPGAKDPRTPAELYADDRIRPSIDESIIINHDSLRLSGPGNLLDISATGIEAEYYEPFSGTASNVDATYMSLSEDEFRIGSGGVRMSNLPPATRPGDLEAGAVIFDRPYASGSNVYYSLLGMDLDNVVDVINVSDSMGQVIGSFRLSDNFIKRTVWVAAHATVMEGGGRGQTTAGWHPLITHIYFAAAPIGVSRIQFNLNQRRQYRVEVPPTQIGLGNALRIYYNSLSVPPVSGATVPLQAIGLYPPLGIAMPAGAVDVSRAPINSATMFVEGGTASGEMLGAIVRTHGLTQSPQHKMLVNNAFTQPNRQFARYGSTAPIVVPLPQLTPEFIRFGQIPVTDLGLGNYMVSSEDDISLMGTFPSGATVNTISVHYARAAVIDAGGNQVSDLSPPFVYGIYMTIAVPTSAGAFTIANPPF